MRRFVSLVFPLAVMVRCGSAKKAPPVNTSNWCNAALPRHAKVLSKPVPPGVPPLPVGVASRFVIVMMGPRVGSKMTVSQLRSRSDVDCLGENTESSLVERFRQETSKRRLASFFKEHAARWPTLRAIGFKTEKYWEWRGGAYTPGEFYAAEKATLFASLGVKAVCLARFNVVAREVAGARKVATAGGGTTELGTVSVSKFDAQHWRAQCERVDQFWRKCGELAQTSEVLWLPYEAAKDGAPGQAATLKLLQRFLGLEPRDLAASTQNFAPKATAAYVSEPDVFAERIRTTLDPPCAERFLEMLYDPLFPRENSSRTYLQ